MKKATHLGTEVSHLSAALPALLSQVLVAFTIEFDNEFEHRSPHWTTMEGWKGPQSGAWLTSMAMYSNLMRLVPDEGITVRELLRQARTPMLPLNHMERWGYIAVAPDANDKRPKPQRNDWVVRPKPKGRAAKHVWEPLFAVVEGRWRERFGEDAIGRLRKALAAMVARLDRALPEYLPVLGFGLTTEVSKPAKNEAPEKETAEAPGMTLAALLAKTLLAFTLDFERESCVSLAINANVLRLFRDEPVRVRDLPRLGGVSKEAIAMATGFLRARKLAVIEPDPAAARGKVVRCTELGLEQHAFDMKLLRDIEDRWIARFGGAAIAELRRALEELAGKPGAPNPLLMAGTEPHPDGWRAKVPRPETLPHYPMVLHRGGYPDGS